MKAILLSLVFVATICADDIDPDLKKKIDPIAKKLASKKADERIAGIKAAAELKEDAISLYPAICKAIFDKDPKIAQQAMIAIDEIDAKLSRTVRKLVTTPAEAFGQLPTLGALSDKERASIRPAIDNVLDTLMSVPPEGSQYGYCSRHYVEAIKIYSKLGEDKKARRAAIVLATFKPQNGSISETKVDAYSHLLAVSENELTKSEREELLPIFFSGLSDQIISVRRDCAAGIGNLASVAKTKHINAIAALAADDKDDGVRKAAREALKKLDK